MVPFQIQGRGGTRQAVKYVGLRGVDMSSDPALVARDMSPWCPNLIGDKGGNPEKRVGWRVLHTIERPVNGLWQAGIGGEKYFFAHGGTRLYAWKPGGTPSAIRDGLASRKSTAFAMGGRLWVLTGREYLACGLFDGTLACKKVEEIAYVPTVVIARGPKGGGTPYESINLISKQQINSFLTTDEQIYQLSATGIKSVDRVVLDGVERVPATDYIVDLARGKVTFRITMPTPPSGGADNLQITFSKEYKGYADRINKCTIAACYGYGANDRVFLSGNPDFCNTDWYSGLDDPSYIPDMGYARVGSEETAVMGYLRIGEYLAVIKEDNQQDSTVFLRAAQIGADGTVTFPLKQGIAGVGAIAKGAFAVLRDEPLFLSRTGVYAVTSNAITAERTVRGRSYYIDAALTKEKGLEEAEAVCWNGYYFLAVNGRAYLLDGRTAIDSVQGDGNTYACRCYHWENIPARVLLEDAGALYFGTENGRICRFNSDMETMERYADDDLENPAVKKAVVAQWATKADDDGDFMTRKTLLKKGSGVMIKPFTRSSVQVLIRSDRDCEARPARYSTMDIWDWEEIDFSRVGFNSNDAPQVVPFRTKVKKYVTLQIVVQNSGLNEGFGVYGIVKRFSVGGHVK